MAIIHAFRPEGQTVKITAGVASAAVQVHPATSKHIRVRNTGSVDVFIAFGTNTVVAAIPVVGTPAWGAAIAPGEVEVFTAPMGYVATIVASGTADLYLTPGEGV